MTKTYYHYQIEYDPATSNWFVGRYWWVVTAYFGKDALKDKQYGVKFGSGWAYTEAEAQRRINKILKEAHAREELRAQVRMIKDAVEVV